jgi:hypothetical protein
MDGSRFDALSRALTATGSRRLTLVALLGGIAGFQGLSDARARGKSGTCKPRCNECERCDKGPCRRRNGKKHCHKGKCKPKPAGTLCAAFPGGVCQNGTCVDVQRDETNCGALGTTCGVTQVCQAGSCFPRSTCPATVTTSCPLAFAIFCGAGAGCRCGHSTEGNLVCLSFLGSFCPPSVPGGTATPCITSATCPSGSACLDISACCGLTDANVCLPQCPTPDA